MNCISFCNVCFYFYLDFFFNCNFIECFPFLLIYLIFILIGFNLSFNIYFNINIFFIFILFSINFNFFLFSLLLFILIVNFIDYIIVFEVLVLILDLILIFKKFILILNSIYLAIKILINYFFNIKLSHRLLWNSSSRFDRWLRILVWFFRFLTNFWKLWLTCSLLLFWRSSLHNILNRN